MVTDGTADDLEPRELVPRDMGLPAVLKDSAGTGSQNVWLVRDKQELDRALDEAASRRLTGRLFAEPYFSGPVYSAETLTWAGHTRLLGVSSRLMSPEPRFREEVTAFPVVFPAVRRAALERWLGSVLAAIEPGRQRARAAHHARGPRSGRHPGPRRGRQGGAAQGRPARR
ncbi:hypothetical protein [Streptomyces endocoffeicus]|uniref:hypothetical protein n=1 Tax=Streptomyces endocoffeicus TaxID=2898945 RepID=UPI001E30794B|nr:hypothetical protein [Streptomyces endocoffeicus]